MRSRTIAIGDVHGCSRALITLLEAIAPSPDDQIVALGDYVNRGPDTRGVLDRLLVLERECHFVPILGNHDQQLLEACATPPLGFFTLVGMGGKATLASYGAPPDRMTATDLARIPPDHIAFLERCRDYHETDTHIFVHAQYDPDMAMEEQPAYLLRWESLRNIAPGPHASGKRVIAGHTQQRTGEVLDLGHLVCIDTCCYGGGWLTALDVRTQEVWQTNQQGELRRS
jgi:serine/threonine protein phosphatase 1